MLRADANTRMTVKDVAVVFRSREFHYHKGDSGIDRMAILVASSQEHLGRGNNGSK